MGAKWAKTKIEIPGDYSPDEREAIAFEIINYIIERTRKGRGPGNQEWSGSAGKYSETYANSLDFKIAGKSKSKVDLTLSSDMLESIELLSNRPGELLIGFENGTDENAKADGNIRGTYGQSSPISGKARPFLDLTDKEIEAILSRFPLDDDRKRERRVGDILTAIEEAEEA